MIDKKEIVAYVAAGCFWGVEEAFRVLPGVIKTRVGYMGGGFPNPTYEDVCGDYTGHAETVEITFDPQVISYKAIVEKFWEIHDPTTKYRQGPDVGSQYRSALFCIDDSQYKEASESKEKLSVSGKWSDPIVTEIIKANDMHFWPAEEYHQQYFMKRGGGTCHV